MKYASQFLEKSQIYTRAQLRAQFQITDATLNTGIFQPAGFDSIWLFVTQKKTPDRIQYVDDFDGETLTMDSQAEGHKDSKLINHEQDGVEILLFHRASKYEFAGAGFRFEGQFRYVSHSGTRPAKFIFQQVQSE